VLDFSLLLWYYLFSQEESEMVADYDKGYNDYCAHRPFNPPNDRGPYLDYMQGWNLAANYFDMDRHMEHIADSLKRVHPYYIGMLDDLLNSVRSSLNNAEYSGEDPDFTFRDLRNVLWHFAEKASAEHMHEHEYDEDTGICYCGKDGNI
jgi:hypothetical protein